MTEKLLQVWKLLRRIPIVGYLGVALLCDMVFINDFSLIDSYRYSIKISQLKKERERYRESIARDRARLEELRTSNENLEKFARETYQMRAADEDVFIIVDED
ncbi:MAG: hypothetical protein IJY36_05965 [Coprobacter sp.]|nr:hypothetical protein [Coprobacter sp.]